MKKDEIFFGENGLTSTSANHTANMAKEVYMNLVEELDHLKFYDESIALIGTTAATKTGSGRESVDDIPAMIEDIAALKSLIAWLREAIKARKNLISELNEYSLADYCEYNKIEMPTAPERESALTEDEYYGSLSIKERNAYYALETKCATLGKYIHENGPYSAARKKLQEIINNPHVVHDSGRDTVIVSRTQSVPTEDVDAVFFKLQAKHREYQAQLNSIKHKCELAIEESRIKVNTEYTQAYSEFMRKRQDLENRFTEWKLAEASKIDKLKIVIPDSLKPIYQKVSAL